MKSDQEEQRRNPLGVHLAAFLLIILSGAALYLAAQRGSITWIWILIGLVVLGNALAVSVP